jgi:hypothetical protein
MIVQLPVPLQMFGIEDERTQRYAKKEVGNKNAPRPEVFTELL